MVRPPQEAYVQTRAGRSAVISNLHGVARSSAGLIIARFGHFRSGHEVADLGFHQISQPAAIAVDRQGRKKNPPRARVSEPLLSIKEEPDRPKSAS